MSYDLKPRPPPRGAIVVTRTTPARLTGLHGSPTHVTITLPGIFPSEYDAKLFIERLPAGRYAVEVVQ